jgi:hypothetical protein
MAAGVTLRGRALYDSTRANVSEGVERRRGCVRMSARRALSGAEDDVTRPMEPSSSPSI